MTDYASGTQPYVVPDAHRAFFAEFAKLIANYPEAARNFGMVELGIPRERQRVIIWECQDFGGFPDCEPKIRDE